MHALLPRLIAVHLLPWAALSAEPAQSLASPKKETQKQVLARLEFNPGGGPWAGETPFQGASWSALAPGPNKLPWMQARAGLGDKFPVQDRAGVTLFEVIFQNGTADHLILVIVSDEEDRTLRVDRDKAVETKVGGVKYTLSFPTQRVAAAPGERPSTNKATIFVTRKP